MRIVVAAAFMIALLGGAAFAQDQQQGPPTARTDAQKKEDAEIEKAYKQMQKAVGGKSAPAKLDPWQGVRSTPPDNPKR